MDDRIYFTRDEAEARVGQVVEALSPFPSVPKGTKGEVTKAAQYMGEHYVLRVKWELPQPRDLVDLTIVEISLNFLKERKPVTDEFCKSEYLELVKVLHDAEAS